MVYRTNNITLTYLLCACLSVILINTIRPRSEDNNIYPDARSFNDFSAFLIEVLNFMLPKCDIPIALTHTRTHASTHTLTHICV